jgi:hypothetical protein
VVAGIVESAAGGAGGAIEASGAGAVGAAGGGVVVVVPEPVVPASGSAGGVLGSGVVVAGVSWLIAGGVCGVSWATAVLPIAARAAANAISFIKLLLNDFRGAICALVQSNSAWPEKLPQLPESSA